MMGINLLLIGTGSLLGGISRYLLSGWIKHLWPSAFPWGTLTVNLIGCFLIGFFSGLIPSSAHLSENHRLLLIVGFCGSFTTFSTFSLENLELLTAKAYPTFFLNAGSSIILGIAATWLGFLICKK